MSTLSPQPYKGTRDYYPEDKRIQNYIFAVMRRTMRRFGYEEYGAPLLEPTEVYEAKSGQELASEQTYAFTDRGDRAVAIRPEMTPSISRMVAARRQELAYPARLFSIANFMRYERPQRGREREFWQLNTDIFGASGAGAEAEIIIIGAEMLKAFGATPDMYTVKINNREVINALMQDYLGLDAVQTQLMIRLFDRRSKLSGEDFRDQAVDIFGVEAAPDGLQKISKLLLEKSIDQLPVEVANHPSITEVKKLFKLLAEAGVDNAEFDVTLMRGLDYYTGTVFEFFDLHPDNNRSLFGGGRYDGLVGLFGAEPLSAVGMAPGYTMTELFLRTHDLLPDLRTATEVYVVVLGEDNQSGADAIGRQLREESVNVEVDITSRKLDKQIKTAIKKGVPYMLFIGEKELKTQRYNLKNTQTSEEEELSLERVVSQIKDRRQKAQAKDDIDELFE